MTTTTSVALSSADCDDAAGQWAAMGIADENRAASELVRYHRDAKIRGTPWTRQSDFLLISLRIEGSSSGNEHRTSAAYRGFPRRYTGWTGPAQTQRRAENYRRGQDFLGMTIYLWVIFGLFFLHEFVVLAQYKINLQFYGISKHDACR